MTDQINRRIRKVSPPLPGVTFDSVLIASEDGSEAYLFDANGRHLETRNTVTGFVKLSFDYDASGRLVGVVDRDGNATVIARNAGGQAASITSPYGKVSTLIMNADGYLERVGHPNGDFHQMSYHGTGGLLASLRDAGGGLHLYGYDALGRLTRDTNPLGDFVTLLQDPGAAGLDLTFTSAEGRVGRYRSDLSPTLGTENSNIGADGLSSTVTLNADESLVRQAKNGMQVHDFPIPDPQYGMQAPMSALTAVLTPQGLRRDTSENRQITRGVSSEVEQFVETATINGRVFSSDL